MAVLCWRRSCLPVCAAERLCGLPAHGASCGWFAGGFGGVAGVPAKMSRTPARPHDRTRVVSQPLRSCAEWRWTSVCLKRHTACRAWHSCASGLEPETSRGDVAEGRPSAAPLARDPVASARVGRSDLATTTKVIVCLWPVLTSHSRPPPRPRALWPRWHRPRRSACDRV